MNGRPRRAAVEKALLRCGKCWQGSPETAIHTMRVEVKGMMVISKALRVGGSTVKRVLTA